LYRGMDIPGRDRERGARNATPFEVDSGGIGGPAGTHLDLDGDVTRLCCLFQPLDHSPACNETPAACIDYRDDRPLSHLYRHIILVDAWMVPGDRHIGCDRTVRVEG